MTFHRYLLLPALALALAGCGSDDEDNNVAGAPAPTTASQPSLANWQSMTAMTGCDFNSIRTMSTSGDFAHDLINNGNGLSGSGTVTDASDVRMPNNASDNANNGGTGSNNGSANGSAMNVASFQCTGTNARTLTIQRNGQFTTASGQQGTLSQAEIDQINQYTAGIGNVNATNVSCENSNSVNSNQLIYFTSENAPRSYIFVADDAGNRQCFLGTREQALGLQQAVLKAVANHASASSVTSDTGTGNGAH